jgi:hypothetical protein
MYYLYTNHSIGMNGAEMIIFLIVPDIRFPDCSHSFDPNIIVERDGWKKLVF